MFTDLLLHSALITEAVKNGILQANEYVGIIEIVSMISSFGLMFLTLILAFYTRNLAIEAKRTREHQTNPNVIITAIHDDDRPTLMVLVIKNIGNGLANNIRFESSVPLCTSFGIDKPTLRDPRLIDSGPLVTGIPSLGPGECRRLNWGQPYALIQSIGSSIITIKCKCENSSGEQMPPSICSIDIESFKNCAGHGSIELRAVKALEGIHEQLKRIKL